MKKLLAAGETRIFALARVFRNRERTALHAPEFTMLEWYRVGEGLEALMRGLRRACCGWRPRRRGRSGSVSAAARPTLSPSRSGLRCARRSCATPGSTFSKSRRRRTRPRPARRRRCGAGHARRRGRYLVGPVQPAPVARRSSRNLGLGRPTFLTDYPASEAALARLSPHDPRVAERFELYACGVELANAFGELTDPASSAAASRRTWR